MNFMIRKPTVLVAAVLAMGLLGTSAHAALSSLTISVQEDSGATQSFTLTGSLITGITLNPGTGSPVMPSTITTTDYSIKVVSGTADQDSSSEVLSSNTSITNTTGNAGHVLHITISGSGYTHPITPPDIIGTSSIGGSISQTATADTLTFQSFVNASGFGVQSPSIGGVPKSVGGSYNNSLFPTYLITSLSSPYSLTEKLDVTLSGRNDKIGYQSQTTLQNVVTPEPSSLVLAGFGALGLIGYGLRRRKGA